MLTQSTGLDFKGQNFFIGIDLHLKSWTVTILTDHLYHKTFTQPASPEVLSDYMKRNFPGGNYYSVYEAGFSGFWAHHKLHGLGIRNIVVNPADVPTMQKEQVQKDDPVDSRKLARSLRSGDLKPIYVPSPAALEDRSLVRARATLVKDLTRFKQRIKSFLYFYGIPYPREFEKQGSHWSKRFMDWLEGGALTQYEPGAQALEVLIKEAKQQRVLLLETTRKIRLLAKEERYAKNMALMRSIPGVGFVAAITFMTEVIDIGRFENTDYLAGLAGLVPNRHNSGPNKKDGEMTFRGNNALRKALIESSWVAVRLDPALSLSYHSYIRRMEPNKAIVRIARKVLNRIYYVLKNKESYVRGIVR